MRQYGNHCLPWRLKQCNLTPPCATRDCHDTTCLTMTINTPTMENASYQFQINSIVRSARGAYILLVRLDANRTITVGRLGAISFPEGFYAYLGSALGGFKPRINRHLIKNKKPKWHIDYLLSEARVSQVILYETEQRLECLLSQALAKELPFIPGFGSSDCRCESHLYFAINGPSLEMDISKVIAQPTISEEHIKGADMILGV